MRRFLLSCVVLIALALPGRADEIRDPYHWLEEATGERALTWVKERNVNTKIGLTRCKSFTALNDRVLKILDSDKRIPFVSKIGGHLYNFWQDGKNKRGVWRRTTVSEYTKADPQWETMLDVDALAESEKESWVWNGASFIWSTHDRCLVTLSRGGADAAVVREFDIATKSFVADGFNLPEAKSIVAWRDRDCLFVATDFGPGSLTRSGYPRLVKEWQRGTPLSEAKLVFEGQPEDIAVSAFRSPMKGFEREFVLRRVTFHKSEFYLRREGNLIKIDKPDDADAAPYRELLYVHLRSPWTINGKTYPSGALLTINLEAFLEGDRQFDVLFEPTERRTLAQLDVTRNHLILNVLDNVRNRVYVLSRKDGGWHCEELPGVPDFGSISVAAVNREESDDYTMRVTDFLTPSTFYEGTVGKGPAKKIKQSPSFFDADGLTVTQHEAVSKDGTRIPYFQVARKDLDLNGKNPTLLYGYGGFEIALLPAYDSITGAAWLEKGGVYVIANIRGGGEFGPRWHQAALKEKRHRAFEDFIAVAEDLVQRKVTAPRHLGIQGASNGGLLMGNMLTLRPDLFGAIVCQVPLLDMRRYHKLLAGASWVAEYGNPDLPEEWEFLRTFSPYHNLKKDARYPRTLFTTSTRDDRVHPSHARKMVAKMRDMGNDVLYYENIEGGHGGAADNSQAAFLSALTFTFLWNELK